MFTPCEGCFDEEEMGICPLYLCQIEEGFTLICCIVTAFNYNLPILGRIAFQGDEEDE